MRFREPGAAEAAGYVLALAGLLVAAGLLFHPPPSGGFEENISTLRGTPWWGAIHVAIAIGFVLTALGAFLALAAGGSATRTWDAALAWGAMAVGMLFFAGVALVNGYVMHQLALSTDTDRALYDAFDRLLIGYGWLGNPLFLAGLTALAAGEAARRTLGMPGWLAWSGLVFAVLSWGRGIGSATGLYFLEPLIYANVPAFLWLAAYGALLVRRARGSAIMFS